MVKIKENMPWIFPDGSVDVELWLQHLRNKGYLQDLSLLRHAFTLSQLAGSDHVTETCVSCLQLGLSMADVLADLEMDQETLAAAIIFESTHYDELSLVDIEEQLGIAIAKIVYRVEKMSAIHNLQALNKCLNNKHQMDNIRKMLLAMVDDPRVVLIKLAERLCVLRTCSALPESMRQHLATEAIEIYAPLANRLGIGAIKWELEDLGFRYLYPVEYKAIAKGLKTKRIERDRYVNLIVEQLNQSIKALGIEHFAVYGRSKHIHSIYRKMMRKNVPLEAIYDATAVRVLVDNTEQCYQVLGMVHNLWRQIIAEFDDYIINPKTNGYQSLHTAVAGPGNCVFEVQIRTFSMHNLAEMGVAAHWKYKEGVLQQASHERKISWLRDILAWHHEMVMSNGNAEIVETEFFDDRVYVFTPDGDVLDLPQGVTPLDFAYHVHSEVGHRCRGAKVNAIIVPLTYKLKTGEKVEILTGKASRPSRDWLNPHLKYLKTSRAKAKVLHWFKMQDYAQHQVQGHEILDRELKSLGIKIERLDTIINLMHFKCLDDLYAAVGRGDLKLNQIINRLSSVDVGLPALKCNIKQQIVPKLRGSDLQIDGVGNLLTTLAKCCQPVPGDDVIGYITVGRGVSVHCKDCRNIIHAHEKQQQRFVEVHWGSLTREHYAVELLIRAFDRPGLLKDLTVLLANEKAHIYSLQSKINKNDNIVAIHVTIEVDGLNKLSQLLNQLQQIPNIFEAKRQI